MRFAQGVKPASRQDDSFGCCLPLWYCPFNFSFNFHELSELTSVLTSVLTSYYNFHFYFLFYFRDFLSCTYNKGDM